MQSEELAKKSNKLNRGGAYADGVDLGMEAATKDHRLAVAAAAAKESGVGYSRYRGKMAQLIEQKRIAAAMIKREYDKAKAESEMKPNSQALAALAIRMGMKLDAALIDFQAYIDLKKDALENVKVDPETGEPLTLDNPDALNMYILRHMPSEVAEVEHQVDMGMQLDAAKKIKKVRPLSPDQIKEEIKNRVVSSGGNLKDPEGEALGYNLIEGEPRERQDAYSALVALSRGQKYDDHGDLVDIDKDEAYALESVAEYHALDTLQTGEYNDKTIDQIVKLINALDSQGIMPHFVHAARMIISDHNHGGGK
jgi:hypothetical protein